MNDLYNETVERNGKIYHYDPESDTYYCKYRHLSAFDKYAWIVVLLVLSIVGFFVDKYHS